MADNNMADIKMADSKRTNRVGLLKQESAESAESTDDGYVQIIRDDGDTPCRDHVTSISDHVIASGPVSSSDVLDRRCTGVEWTSSSLCDVPSDGTTGTTGTRTTGSTSTMIEPGGVFISYDLCDDASNNDNVGPAHQLSSHAVLCDIVDGMSSGIQRHASGMRCSAGGSSSKIHPLVSYSTTDLRDWRYRTDDGPVSALELERSVRRTLHREEEGIRIGQNYPGYQAPRYQFNRLQSYGSLPSNSSGSNPNSAAVSRSPSGARLSASSPLEGEVGGGGRGGRPKTMRSFSVLEKNFIDEEGNLIRGVADVEGGGQTVGIDPGSPPVEVGVREGTVPVEGGGVNMASASINISNEPGQPARDSNLPSNLDHSFNRKVGGAFLNSSGIVSQGAFLNNSGSISQGAFLNSSLNALNPGEFVSATSRRHGAQSAAAARAAKQAAARSNSNNTSSSKNNENNNNNNNNNNMPRRRSAEIRKKYSSSELSKLLFCEGRDKRLLSGLCVKSTSRKSFVRSFVVGLAGGSLVALVFRVLYQIIGM